MGVLQTHSASAREVGFDSFLVLSLTGGKAAAAEATETLALAHVELDGGAAVDRERPTDDEEHGAKVARQRSPKSSFMLRSSAGVKGYWSNSELSTQRYAFTLSSVGSPPMSVHS